MAIDILQSIVGGITASLVWFMAGSVLYMNPFVAKIYNDAQQSPGLKKWPNTSKYLSFQFYGILAQCLLWAFVYSFLIPVLPGGTIFKGVTFGLILVAVKIFPRFVDMWTQSTYPDKLLVIEFVNGTIGSFIIGVVFAYLIR